MTKSSKKEKLYSIEDDIENYLELKNGWWCYCSLRGGVSSLHNRTRIHAQKAKADPKLCPKCNYVWAREYCASTKTSNSVILTDFPKYKLNKEVCMFCIQDNVSKK
mgnify:CR=1 FL=1|jgi:hypothetical protein|tara:strand:+ start:6321 stop:6638 length:318 start_codon:yes stop_codon:yes gene_type:complete